METLIGSSDLLLEKAADLINKGEIVGFPTETVYGLGADALNEKAIQKIFSVKGRPVDNPLIVHVSNLSQVNLVAKEIPKEAILLWEKFSPGPLTVVLKKQDRVPDIATGGLSTVGVRFPKNDLAIRLINLVNKPLVAPSANISGRLSPTTARAVYEDLNGKIPLILDGGPASVGIESTIVDLTQTPYKILRPGSITADMLLPILGTVENYEGEILIAYSPGMKYKHYSPLCPCVGSKSILDAINFYYQLIKKDKECRPVIIGTSQSIEKIDNKNINTISLGHTPEECMTNFYQFLRDAENDYNYIILEILDDKTQFHALNNRIRKATGYVLIEKE